MYIDLDYVCRLWTIKNTLRLLVEIFYKIEYFNYRYNFVYYTYNIEKTVMFCILFGTCAFTVLKITYICLIINQKYVLSIK